MSTAENKARARRIREEIWNTANFAGLEDLFTSDHVLNVVDPVTPDMGRGPAGFKQLVTLYRGGFPDARLTVEDSIAEGDRVVVRWTARATNTKEFMGSPPTGKQVSVTGTDIYRFAGDKIAETWIHWDTVRMLQELGLAPP